MNFKIFKLVLEKAEEPDHIALYLYAGWNSAIKLRATVIYLWTNTTVVFILTACGGELTGEGIIRSPFYPNVYPGERVCVWTIRQPQSQVVLLNFTAFDMGGSAHCDTDYIEVRVKHLNICIRLDVIKNIMSCYSHSVTWNKTSL